MGYALRTFLLVILFPAYIVLGILADVLDWLIEQYERAM